MIISEEDKAYIANELKKGYDVLGGENPHNKSPPIDPAEFNRLKEENHQLKIIESTIKPFEKRYKQDPGVLRVDLPISTPEIYNMARLSSILRTVHLNLKNEIFRRGLRWKKRFEVKCLDCGKEYPKEIKVCKCGSRSFRLPNDNALVNLERLFTSANKNGEPLIDVFKEGEYDLEIMDDAYIILIKEYMILENKVIGSRIKEVIRGDPEFLRIVGNEKSERGGRFWVCHDKDTEVLTKSGWKYFKNVSNEDEIATLKDGRYLEYQKSTAKIEQHYEGKMLHFVGQMKDIMVTPEHLMYVQKYNTDKSLGEWELKPAKDLLGAKNYHYMKRNVEWVGKEEEYFILPEGEYNLNRGSNQHKICNSKHICTEKKIKMDDWLEFLGYYLSEGSYSEGCNSIQITQFKYPDEMEICLKRLPFDYIKIGQGFSIHSRQLVDYVIKLGHSRDKYIPKEFLNLSSRQLKILYDAMVLGDGGRSITKSGIENSGITTTSKQLSDNIHEILLKMGENPQTEINEYKYQKGNFGNTTWETDIRYDIGTRCRELFIQGNKVQEVEYNDMVYCLEVPNHIIYTRRNGKSVWGGNCPIHRNLPTQGINVTDPQEKMLGRHYEQPGNCPICGLSLSEVFYVSVGGARSMDPEQYYIDGEIIHGSKYSPSRTYGYPPVLSIWKEVSTLLNMQHFVNEYFKYMRAPRGILTTTTSNTESAYKVWDKILENIKRDPHYIPMLAIQDNGTGKRQNQFEWISFTNTLQEMEYGNVRDELRIRVSALYGVSNVMMGDTKGGGGIGNEGLQIVVSDRAVQWGQEVWNQNIFPELCRQFDILDYVLELRPNIELVEQKKLEIQLQKLQIAEGMWRMGFQVELDEEGNFKYSGEAIDMREQIASKSETDVASEGKTPESKVISEDHVTGLSTGQKMLGKTPRGSGAATYT